MVGFGLRDRPDPAGPCSESIGLAADGPGDGSRRLLIDAVAHGWLSSLSQADDGTKGQRARTSTLVVDRGFVTGTSQTGTRPRPIDVASGLMIRIELSVDDLASTRFGISPLTETVLSLRALADPAQHTLHLPWLRALPERLRPDDLRLLLSLVGASRRPPDFRSHPSQAIADFLTPIPTRFMARFDEQVASLRATSPEIVRRDLIASHTPDPLPETLRAASVPTSNPSVGSSTRSATTSSGTGKSL